ncbi:hypothetical protein BX616_006204, partial [Lobosporangium transversale]
SKDLNEKITFDSKIILTHQRDLHHPQNQSQNQDLSLRGVATHSGKQLDMMMEHPQQPLDLRQLHSQQQQPHQQQISTPTHIDPSSTASFAAFSQSLAMEPIHPFQTASPSISLGSLSSAGMTADGMPLHPQTTMSQHSMPQRPLWHEQGPLSHRGSFHNLISASREDRLRARQDRGSIISLASTVGEDSPSEFSALDLEPTLGDLHSQQGASGVGIDNEEYDHQGIGTEFAMMSVLDYNLSGSRSSPGGTSVEGDLSSAQPSRSNSVMLDPSTVMKVNAMFNMGEEPLHLQAEQFNGSSSLTHPLSKEVSQQPESSLDGTVRFQTMAPGQHPNETEGTLSSLWSGSMDMLAASVHPFSMPPYMNDGSQSISSPADPALLDGTRTQEHMLQTYDHDGSRPALPTSVSSYSNCSSYFDGNKESSRT